ncbi:MAG: DUF3540 domain-containing protein [Rhodocyclaceae bacterium]
MDSAKLDHLTRIAPTAVHVCCELLSITGEDYLVGADWGQLNARRAASCQLLPAVGDKLLVSGTLPDQVYIIAVLERASSTPLETRLGEGVTLSVATAGELKLVAERQLQLHSEEVLLKGTQAQLIFSRVKAIAGEAVLGLRQGRLFGDLFETSLSRLSQLLGNSQRTVQGLDQVRSANIDYQADETVHIHGRNVLTDAEKLIRVDGEQVHIG